MEAVALKATKVKVIAKLVLYSEDNTRHYPPSHGNARAGEPFLVSVQNFSPKSMRLAPDSRYTFEQVMKMKADYKAEVLKADPNAFMDDYERLANGLSRPPYIPPIDLGIEETPPLNEGESMASIQAKIEPRSAGFASAKSEPTGNKQVI